MEAWIEILRTDGTSERHRLELGRRVTLGASPTADLPLVNDALLPLHIVVNAAQDGVRFALADSANPARAGGKPVRQGLVPWGAEIELGAVTLKFHDKAPLSKGQKRASPILLLGIVALPLAAWYLLDQAEGGLPERPNVPPPPLFDEPPACTEAGAAALHRGHEAAETATYKAERYPFDVRDGIEAAQLFGVAERCFQTAGAHRDAARVARARRTVERLVNEDYRMLRLRLDLALEHDRPLEALREVRWLRSMVQHREGEYTQWLALLERQLPMLVLAASEDD